LQKIVIKEKSLRLK